MEARRRRKNQIPTVPGDDAGYEDNWVRGEKRISESLLAGAWNARREPVWIGHRANVHHMDQTRINDLRRGQDVRHDIEGAKGLVNGDLKNSRGGIE